mmetsp:Transcript_1740/g.3861  ORF Transcript_1740/g.3861 Transcript_1740/m.3861 type:complete len:89 (-) Transcript_1740:95-361(-)
MELRPARSIATTFLASYFFSPQIDPATPKKSSANVLRESAHFLTHVEGIRKLFEGTLNTVEEILQTFADSLNTLRTSEDSLFFWEFLT